MLLFKLINKCYEVLVSLSSRSRKWSCFRSSFFKHLLYAILSMVCLALEDRMHFLQLYVCTFFVVLYYLCNHQHWCHVHTIFHWRIRLFVKTLRPISIRKSCYTITWRNHEIESLTICCIIAYSSCIRFTTFCDVWHLVLQKHLPKLMAWLDMSPTEGLLMLTLKRECLSTFLL